MKNKNLPLFRHELKYIINEGERIHLLKRLQECIPLDEHQKEKGYYTIRSLYFDDLWNRAYEEKNMGVTNRKKFRIRIYDFSDRVIHLEKKEKQGQYIRKISVNLTREETEAILHKDYGFLLKRKEPLCQEFYVECTSHMLLPKVIVDYEREAYVLEAGSVRITFDSHVRAAHSSFDIFDKSIPAYEVLPEKKMILEIKYTEFYPQLLRQIIVPGTSEFSAVSKYVLCCDKRKEILV